MQQRLQLVEETTHKWFKAELPRLLSGLPINEDDISMRNLYMDNDVLLYPLYSTGDSENDNKLNTQSKSYAMAQALCSSKAIQTATEFQAAGLAERNSVLKDRVIELEGVIMRWKNHIEKSNNNNNSSSPMRLGQTSYSANVPPPHSPHPPAPVFEERNYAETMNELINTRHQYMEAEEKATKLNSQLELSQERSEAMRKLAEHMRKEEREDRYTF